MNNQELRDILIKELGIENLSGEAQDEIVAKIGEMVLKSLTASIFEKLTPSAKEEFNRISAAGNPAAIQGFLEENAPGIHEMMAEELKKTLASFKEKAV
jgi:hypothetical protein